ncbi:MAG: DUF5655 domain-containing protein [Hyphomicrobiaceae bacterium]
MSRNFADLERELIEDLEHRTGRNLADWMSAIDAAGLTGKNAVIDWLRPQGFTFANASWLERIHNNGGRPIYLDQPAPSSPGPVRSPQKPVEIPQASPPAAALAPMPAPTPVTPAPPAPGRPLPAAPAPQSAPATGGDPDRLAELLTRGKAYRPLAEMLLREIERTLPDVVIDADGELARLYRPRELAALQVTPKELRLCLDLGDAPYSAPLARTRVPGASTGLTHMIILKDARQIDAALMALVSSADQRANPPPPGAGPDH